MSEEIRNNLHGALDTLEGNLTHSEHELSPTEFVKQLNEAENEQVNGWLTFLDYLNSVSYSRVNPFSAVAVGSILEPKRERVHDPRDIDIIFLTSGKPRSSERIRDLYLLQTSILSRLIETKLRYDMEKPLLHNKCWFGDADVTFRVHTPNTRPVHITYAGIHADDASSRINRKRKNNNYFALLLDGSKEE